MSESFNTNKYVIQYIRPLKKTIEDLNVPSEFRKVLISNNYGKFYTSETFRKIRNPFNLDQERVNSLCREYEVSFLKEDNVKSYNDLEEYLFEDKSKDNSFLELPSYWLEYKYLGRYIVEVNIYNKETSKIVYSHFNTGFKDIDSFDPLILEEKLNEYLKGKDSEIIRSFLIEHNSMAITPLGFVIQETYYYSERNNDWKVSFEFFKGDKEVFFIPYSSKNYLPIEYIDLDDVDKLLTEQPIRKVELEEMFLI